MMEFNASKCEVIRISNKRKNIDASYSIHNETLQQTKKAKYLGAVLTPNMTWNAPVDTVTQKANNTLAFLRRNLGSCPGAIKEASYKTVFPLDFFTRGTGTLKGKLEIVFEKNTCLPRLAFIYVKTLSNE